MITFPNAKINLGLNIVEKRPDGYHNLETVFYPVPLEDALEVNILHEGNEKFRLHQAGLEIEGEVENNLVVKAYKLLDEKFNLPPVVYLFRAAIFLPVPHRFRRDVRPLLSTVPHSGDAKSTPTMHKAGLSLGHSQLQTRFFGRMGYPLNVGAAAVLVVQVSAL